MPQVTKKLVREAQSNFYKYKNTNDGFVKFTEEHTGTGISHYWGSNWPREVPDKLYNLITNLASPHYHSILKAMKARKCREQ